MTNRAIIHKLVLHWYKINIFPSIDSIGIVLRAIVKTLILDYNTYYGVP